MTTQIALRETIIIDDGEYLDVQIYAEQLALDIPAALSLLLKKGIAAIQPAAATAQAEPAATAQAEPAAATAQAEPAAAI